ncbi:PQQ-binding-like beta-propeller repeat protein [Actinoallomurus acanthiterrae]
MRNPTGRFSRSRAWAVSAGAFLALGSLVGTVACTSHSASDVSARSPVNGSADEWPSGGQNTLDTHGNPAENQINASDVSGLATRWTATMHGDVSATPAVVGGAVYVPDFGGYFTKYDARTGRVIWSHKVSEYTGDEKSFSRTSPAVSGNTVYLGDHYGLHATGSAPPVTADAARLLAVDTASGKLRWKSVLDTQFAAWLTQSPLVHDGVIYEGIASGEEDQAAAPTYQCCKFRGNMVAISEHTHKVLWRTYFQPPNGGKPGGYSGAAIWSGTPAIDPVNNTVVITTGNNYAVPASVTRCRKAGGTPEKCFSPDNHMDSIIALDLRTGKLRWATGAKSFDSWNSGCLPGAPPNNCAPDHGPDADFGDAAHISVVNDHGIRRALVGAGQKSGIYWQLDGATGKILWSAAPGPSGQQGGIQWGSATDGRRVYVAESNADSHSYRLPNGKAIDYGSFAALDAVTGKLAWQTADPSKGHDKAPLTVADGVVYAGSTTGHMYALNAATGRVLWDQKGQGSSLAGPAVVDGTVYWGNGYTAKWATPGTTFYAFGLPGR